MNRVQIIEPTARRLVRLSEVYLLGAILIAALALPVLYSSGQQILAGFRVKGISAEGFTTKVGYEGGRLMLDVTCSLPDDASVKFLLVAANGRSYLYATREVLGSMLNEGLRMDITPPDAYMDGRHNIYLTTIIEDGGKRTILYEMPMMPAGRTPPTT